MSFDTARVRAALGQRRIDYYDSLGSTMTAAAAIRESGAIVIANEQSAGQGRHGHVWHSEPGSGLYFTIVLTPDLSFELVPVITLALGLAVQEAIAQTCNLQPDLRWPNDLLIGPRKCAGILAQLDGARVLAGIGINVNHASLPPELAAIATSLRLATGREHAREELLCAVAGGVDRMVGLLETEGASPVLALFTAHSSYVRGRRVRVDLPGSPLSGTTAGLTPDGYLLLDGDDGRRHTIISGGVRPEN